MMIISSAISLLAMMVRINKLDNAQTSEDRDKALDDIYRYLDKSSYEKVNYFSL